MYPQRFFARAEVKNHERENYSWGVIQSMIEREIHEAFKIREPQEVPSKKEIKQLIRNTVHDSRR